MAGTTYQRAGFESPNRAASVRSVEAVDEDGSARRSTRHLSCIEGSRDSRPARSSDRRLASDEEADRLIAQIVAQGGIQYCPEHAARVAERILAEIAAESHK